MSKRLKARFVARYWTVDQMVAHHTYTGCNLRPGDLLGTGTISCDVSPLGAALLKSFLPQDHFNKHWSC